MKNKSIADKLTEARNSLTPKTWQQGNWFKADANGQHICMCAHGAVQAVVNPTVKNIIRNYTAKVASRKLSSRKIQKGVEGAANVGSDVCFGSRKMNTIGSLKKLFNNRTKHHFHPDDLNDMLKNNPELNAHYLLGMVGLTVGFNDGIRTSLRDVKKKFTKAIALAKSLNL